MEDIDNNSSHLIKIKSSDGSIFEIEESYIKRSKYLQEMKDILNLNEELIFKEFDSKTLNKVI